MANERGWWKLVITGDDVELDDYDRSHIAELICQGYTEGEIVKTEDEEENQEEDEYVVEGHVQ